MTVLSIIVSTAVASLIVFILRSMDKDKNHIERVKKYADGRQTQFDDYFKEQWNKLSGLMAEFDTKKITMTATINRVERQISDFKQIESNFSSQFEVISDMEKKIKDFHSTLSELDEMTSSVERNLQLVK